MRTIATICLNMGYMDGTEEKIMSVEQAQVALESLIQHKKDLLPEPDDLDLAPQVKVHEVLFVSLVPGKCSCEEGRRYLHRRSVFRRRRRLLN